MFKRISMVMAVVFVSLIFATSTIAADKGVYSSAPITKKGGGKFRIGFYEGGPYKNYPMVLKAVVKGFMQLGWMPQVELPVYEDKDDSRQMWEWLSENANSPNIDFVKKAYWSSNWETEIRTANKEACIQYLKKKNIDLIIAMGTWAGQDLANNQHGVPTIVCSSTGPISSGIIKSIEDSGFDHVHARLDPTIHERQIKLFHDIIGFQTLGVAYEDTKAGRSYAAVDVLDRVAKDRGFKVVRCFTKDDIPDKAEAEASVVKCYEEIATKVDAVYVTIQSGVNPNNMEKLLAPLNKNKLPTFSQGGSDEVKLGVLLSIAQAEFVYVGKFHAEVMAKVFNGAKPRDLEQVYEDPSKIAINLAIAEVIDYFPAVDILGAADEIYQDLPGVEPPPED